MTETTYTTVDRIIAKFHRDLKGTDINESDVIEWIGEALEFLKVQSVQEQAVAFMEVNNHHATIPDGFQMVLQIARNNHWSKKTCTPDFIKNQLSAEPELLETCDTCLDCGDEPIFAHNDGFIREGGEIIDYLPYFDLQFNYQAFLNSNYYRKNYTTVRLADHTLFNTIVCKEKVDYCMECKDEYTIVGTTEKKLRFSFSEGYVAMSYLRNSLDPETGYPLVPDNISYVTAIGYYIKWKLAEWYQWNGRAGYDGIVQDTERKWIKYVNQAKNYAKMPKSLDDYQDLLEQSHYLVPNHKKYYNYFGNLNQSQRLNFSE